MNNKKLIFGLILAAFIIIGIAASLPVRAGAQIAKPDCSSLPVRNLTIGISGSDVGFLQQVLITGGYLRISTPTNYFGPLTKAALASGQAETGVANPGTGYFGPLSLAKLRQLYPCGPGPDPIGSALRVVSPNGGEQWLANSAQDIKWAVANPNPGAKVDLYLNPYAIRPTCLPNQACLFEPILDFVLDKNIDANAVYHWIVATDITNQVIPAGQYRVRVCLAGSTTNCDTSDDPFMILDANQAQITLTSPNGGEQWLANSVQDIKFIYPPHIPEILPTVDLYLDRDPQIYCFTTPCDNTYVLDKNIDANSVYHWIVATDITNKVIPAGQYRVRVCLAGSTTNCDSSDAPFTITSTVPTGACYVGGCSAQLCSDQPDLVSTCEYRPEYSCYRNTGAKCERQASGQCGWTTSPALTSCLANQLSN